MNRKRLIAFLAVVLLAGCASNQLVAYDPDMNFLSFKHAYTEQAEADVRVRANRLCGQRKQIAVRTAWTCSLTECTTNYRCIDAADAAKYGL